MSASAAIIASLSSAVIGVAGAWVGNYYLRHKVERRQREAEAVRSMLYQLTDLVARYWTDDHHTSRSLLEGRIMSQQHLVIRALSDMKDHSKKLRKWHESTEANRLSLLEAASGGPFQDEHWQPDRNRVRTASREVAHIVSELSRAC